MDQMLAWTFIHREFARRYGARPRTEDDFYRGDIHASPRGRTLVGVIWRSLRRGG